jgi:hypothetical protein
MSMERDYRAELTADCTRCFALCCVAPGFSASADFAISKSAGMPCPHLAGGFRCGIHSHLGSSGFAGCTVYECYGAGQKIAQVTFGGRDWRRNPGISGQMFAAFAVMRDLHELMWYLAEALSLPPARPVREPLLEAVADLSRLTRQGPEELAATDLGPQRGQAGALLRQVGRLVRGRVLAAFLDSAGVPLGDCDLAQSTGMPPETLSAVLLRLARERSISCREAGSPAMRRAYTLTAEGAQAARREVALLAAEFPGLPG